MAKANASAVPAVKKVRKLPRNWKWGVAFITPWIIGFLAFQLYPLLASLYYSFTDFSVLADGKWVGVENYVKLFTKDKHFLKSLWLTVKYAIMSVPVKLAFALFIAMLLNMKLRGINMFRTIYYLPSIMGGSVAVSILWKFLFMQDGIVNKALAVFHIPAVSWLGDPNMALVTVSLLVVWQFGSSMVLFLAGLKNVPQELYEAASVDGASKVRQFFKITLPMITPIVFFNLMMQTINALQEFTSVSIITNGGPNRGTYLLGLKIYEEAFTNSKMGYASATSWVLFAIVLVVTGLLFKTSDAWVYYEDGGMN
ncbi:carbohydrate ABC transporter permease [Cuneatibacter caecimuris]|uniref:Carbohydrate ABC transporter membrane protein 1 (CUT1 family) n=1 Tax=Cuneatibacter caecimuris TaxID=1796618 RepID=A0A4V2F8D8_9FIRM|nr:sugar ABC transporter permease [Cuneatibacter caecimuris]RZT03067.1 carbohydrate ABC transporter membrane protein 1 (CUT1 family) [Cuneatibacter caecimuris]